MGEKWNSRKVVFGLLLLLVGVAVEMLGPRGLTETMSMFLIATGAAYFVGNVGDKLAENKGKSSSAQVDTSTLQTGVEALNQKIDAIAQNSQNEREGYLQILDGILKKQDAAISKVDYVIKKADL